MEENPQHATRWPARLFFPIVVAIMLPLGLIVGALVYLRALAFGVVALIALVLGRKPAVAANPFQEPHFRDAIRRKVGRE